MIDPKNRALSRFSTLGLQHVSHSGPRPPVGWLGVLLIYTVLWPIPTQGASEEVPQVETVFLRTKDGVNLHCVFFPGSQGKNSVPVILLHAWKGQNSECLGLASGLQKRYQCAVIVPDLRGHGKSATRTLRRGGTPEKIRLDRMRPDDIRKMFLFDLEAVKKFLLEKHNAGELNIELLCVVGAEMGATVAVNWAALDWSWPQLPTYKQGQDVRALVLISPPQTFKGVRTQEGLKNRSVRSRLSVMIIHGKRKSKDARQIYNALRRWHNPERNDLELVAVDSDLEGTELLIARNLGVASKIARFIRRRLVDLRGQYPWQPRVNPLDS